MSDQQASQEKTDTLERVPIDKRSLTINEFCEVENISRSFFNKLRRLNLGPLVTEIFGPGLNLRRITPESRREWHQRMKKYRESKQAQIAHERHHQQLLAAGQRSAEGPRHVSKQGKKKKPGTRSKRATRAEAV